MEIDWKLLFVPSTSILEIVLRGTIIYLLLFLLFRILRREAGALGLSDLLVVVLIADAAQNAMAGEYKSITEGVVLVGTIFFWDYSLDWLGYKIPFVGRLLRPSALLLIKDGRLQRRNMRQEMVTEEELMGQLRQQGIENFEEVEKSYLEGDGQISIIKKTTKNEEAVKNRKRPSK